MVQAADHLDEALLNTLYLPLSRTLHLLSDRSGEA